MATINRGVVPLDPTSAVGQVRLLIGDLDYEEYDPVQVGYGIYANFSDAELAGFVTAGGDSVTRATGYAYLRLAALAASGAISWKSDDLAVDSKQVATEYRLLANIAFAQADDADVSGASSFTIDNPYTTVNTPTGWSTVWGATAELAAPTYPFAIVEVDSDADEDVDGGTP
jgi:hypothetical protein